MVGTYIDTHNLRKKSGEISDKTGLGLKQFLQDMGASEEAQDDKFNHHALLVLIAPSSYANLPKFF